MYGLIILKFVKMDSSLQKEVTAKMEVLGYTCLFPSVL